MDHLIQAISALAGIAFTLIGIIYYSLVKKLDKNAELSTAIQESLNKQIIRQATLTQRIDQAMKDLADHELRIRSIETKKS